MNTGELQMVFCSGSDAQVAGRPITWNPYSRNGSGAWLAWQAGWLQAARGEAERSKAAVNEAVDEVRTVQRLLVRAINE
ncbi:MAG: hypothetical protein H7839_17645 [Magnetococcus sp. YQC-5]